MFKETTKMIQEQKVDLKTGLLLKKVEPDSYRFINLGLFLLVAISNSIPLQAFTGVSFIISDIYKESILIVNINWISYFLLYMVMILPTNYIIDKKGLKTATLISQTCMILGLTLRCLINLNITYFFLGSLLCSFGFCLNISAANKLPGIWFLDRQIFGVKSLLIFALLFSDAIGYSISTFFITKQSTKTDVLRFFIIESSILIIFQIVNMLFFKGKPQNPQNHFSRKLYRNFGRNISKLVSNSNYLMLFLAMTFIFIDLSVLFVGFSQFQKSYQVSQGNIKVGMFLVFLSGFLGCTLNSFYYPYQYKWKCVVFFLVNSMSHCLLWLGLETKQEWLINLAMIGIGVSILPLITTIVDWACQCSFPVGQGTAGGSLFFGGYAFGSIITLLFDFYIGHDTSRETSRVTILTFLAFIMLSFLFVMLADQKLERKEYEQTKVIEEKMALIRTSQLVSHEVII